MRVEPPEHEEQGEGAGMMRWLLTYADMITLLLVFFIVLYSLSTMQKQRYEALVQALHAVLTGHQVMVSPVKAQKTAPYPLKEPHSHSSPGALKLKAKQTKLYQKIERAIQKNHLQGEVQATLVPYGVEVVFLHGILFDNGKASLGSAAARPLDVIGTVIRSVKNDLIIQGDTNSLPIATSQYPSNWDLSAARAARVIDFWRGQGIAPSRFLLEGFGRWSPLLSNSTKKGLQENRSASVVVLNTAVNLRDVAIGSGPMLQNP